MRDTRSRSPDSLFSEDSTASEGLDESHQRCGAQVNENDALEVDVEENIQVATRMVPPIPGSYLFPGILLPEIANTCLISIAQADHFIGGKRDQVMLFGRTSTSPPSELHSDTGIPSHITHLLDEVRTLIAHLLPPELGHLLWTQSLARQVILNLYPPGQGISSHIDLPNRYADGIIGISLCGGCVMTFTRQEGEFTDGPGQRYDVYIPPLSVYVLSGSARWEWAHGIPARTEDLVLDDNQGKGKPRTILRDLRVSVTARWMLPGADLLS